MKSFTLILALGLGLVASTLGVSSLVQAVEPSLCSSHTRVYRVDGEQVSVIMDHEDPFTWYFVPNKLVIAHQKSGDEESPPVYTMLEYQMQGGGPNTVEGGILQFAVTMDMSRMNGGLKRQIASDLDSIKRRSLDPLTQKMLGDKKKRVNDSDINLIPLPFDSTRVLSVGLGPKNPKAAEEASAESSDSLVSKAHVTEGFGPAFGPAPVPMSFELSRMGSDVIKALTQDSSTGVMVTYAVTYTGMTPEIGYKVTVDWDRTFEHFSKEEQTKTSTAGSFFGIDISASNTEKNKEIANKLIEEQAIKIEITEGAPALGLKEGEVEPSNAEDRKNVAGYLDELLKLIYEEVFKDSPRFKALTAEESASADPLVSERLTVDGLRTKEEPALVEGADPIQKLIPAVSFERTVATLKINNRATGKGVFTRKTRSYERRSAMIGGFIGIGNYKPNIKDPAARMQLLKDEKLWLVVGDGDWERAKVNLPKMTGSLAADFTDVTMSISIIDPSKEGREGVIVAPRMAMWSSSSAEVEGKRKWSGGDYVSASGDSITWALEALKFKHGKKFNDFKYHVVATLTPKDHPGQYQVEYDTPLTPFDLNEPFSQLMKIKVDPRKMRLKDGDELFVTITAENAPYEIETVFRKVANQPLEPKNVYLPLSAKEVKYRASFAPGDDDAPFLELPATARTVIGGTIALKKSDPTWKED